MYDRDLSTPWSTTQSPTRIISLLSWRRMVEVRVFNVHWGTIFEDVFTFFTEVFVLVDVDDDTRREVRRVVGKDEGIWKDDTRHSSKLMPKKVIMRAKTDLYIFKEEIW